MKACSGVHCAAAVGITQEGHLYTRKEGRQGRKKALKQAIFEKRFGGLSSMGGEQVEPGLGWLVIWSSFGNLGANMLEEEEKLG